MAAHVIFIGDRVSAAGFRLGGAEVMDPDPGRAVAALEAALGSADLVVMTAECASQVPGEVLQRAYSSLHPLFLVVPDVRGRMAPDDSVARVRRQLGMAE